MTDIGLPKQIFLLRFSLEPGIIVSELLLGGKGFGYEEDVVDASNPYRGISLLC